MKKILTASLVAIMAVSAANADIASTKYVDDQTGVSADGTFGFGGVISDQTTLAGAVKKIANELGTGGSVTTQITNALKSAEATDFSDKVKASLGKADTAVQSVTAGATNGTISVDGTEVSVAGLGSAAYTDANAYDSAGSAAAAQAAAEKTAGEALAAAKSELEGMITDASSDTTELAGRVGVIENSAAYKSGINAEKVAQIETNKTGVAANLASIQAINNEQNGILAQAKADAASKASAAQTAAEGYTDTKVGGVNTALTNYKEANDAALAGVRATAEAAAVKTDVDASILDLQGKINAVEAGTSLADNAVNTKNIAGKAVTTEKIADAAVTETQLNSTVNASLGKANTAVQKTDVITGTTNGTIKVQGTEVSVAGLGSAAYTESGAYATAAQGAKADTAMQASELKELASWSSEGCATGTCSLVSKEGSIAWEKVSY